MHKAIVGLLVLISMLGTNPVVADENTDWVAIEAEGIGETQDAAVQMALQEAVTEAVGSLVTAKTLIENGQIVQDSIISHSGGFVESYEIDEGPVAVEGGLVRVRITARVGRTRLVSTLQEIKIELNEFAGRDLAAQAFSIDLSRKTGREIWGEVIDDFLATEKMYIPTVVGYQLLNTQGPVSQVAFSIRIDANRAYYFDECLPALMTVAEQTCIERIDKPFEVKLKERAFTGGVEGGNGERDVAEVIEYKDLAKRMQDIDKKLTKNAGSGAVVHSLFFLAAIDGNKAQFVGFTFERDLYSYIATKMCRVGPRTKVKDESYYGGYAGIPYDEPVLSLRCLDGYGNETVLRRYSIMNFMGPGSVVQRGNQRYWQGSSLTSEPDRFARKYMLAISPMITNQYGGGSPSGILVDHMEFGAILIFETSELSQVQNVVGELSEAGRGNSEGLGFVLVDTDDPWVGRFRDHRMMRDKMRYRERNGDVPDDDKRLIANLLARAKEDSNVFIESKEMPGRLWVRVEAALKRAEVIGDQVYIEPGFYMLPQMFED